MGCFVVAEFLLTSASRGPSAIAEPLVLLQKSSCFHFASKILVILQGSVATYLRCDGIFIDDVIANFLLIQTENNFVNRLIFDKVKAYKNLCQIFWAIL